MAKKVFLKDHDDIEILPITRGELVLDSSGNPAFSSNEFLATTSQPGLMSKEDKSKIDNLSSIGDLTDEKVKQIATTTNASYRLLFSGTADDTTRIEYTGKSSKLLYNPSTGYLTSTKFVGDLAGTAANATRTKYIETMTYTGESWYGDRYKLYAQWFNGTICDWKSTDDTNNEYQVRVDIAKKLNTPRLLWGNEFDGTKDLFGHITINQRYYLRIKTDTGQLYNTLGITSGNRLYIGYASAQDEIPTYLWGCDINFINSKGGTIMKLTDKKQVLIGLESATSENFTLEISGLSRIYASGQSVPLGSTPTNGLVLGSAVGLQSQFYFDSNGYLNIQGQNVSDKSTRAINLNPLGGAVNIASADAPTNVFGELKVGSGTLGYINMVGSSVNYLWAATTIHIGLSTVGGRSGDNATLTIKNDSIHSGFRNDAVSLGTSSVRWSNVYSVNGNFSENIRIANDYGLLSATTNGSVVQMIGIGKNNALFVGTDACIVNKMSANVYGSIIRFYTGASLEERVNPMTLTPEGRVLIGTTTDNGAKVQVAGNVSATNFIGNLDGQYINALTNYVKATAISALAATDTLNAALGKLEYKADVAYNLVKGAYDGDGTIENLEEILRVLDGIKDTETIQAIVGKYLPLTGGTIKGTGVNPLNINTTNEAEVGIYFNQNNKSKAWVGYSASGGAGIYDVATKSTLGITIGGVPHFNKKTLIHEGNIKDYKAGGLHTPVSLWNNTFDGTQSLGGRIAFNKGFAAMNVPIEDGGSNIEFLYVNPDGHLLLGQGLARKEKNTFIYGNNIKLCYGTVGTSANTAMTITDEGNVLVNRGSNAFGARISTLGLVHIEGGASSVSSIGDIPANGLTIGYDTLHVMAQWVHGGNGSGNIQAMRVDSDKKAYALNLNPLGGAVNVGEGGLNVAGAGSFSSSLTVNNVLYLNRSGHNYIWASKAESPIHLGLKDVGDAGVVSASLSIYPTYLIPGTRNNTVSLGTSNYRWSDVCSVNGNFSNAVTVGSTILGIKPADGTYNRWKIVSSTGGLYIQSSSYNGQYATGIINMTGYNDNNLTSFNVKSVLSTFSGRVLIGGTEDDGESELQLRRSIRVGDVASNLLRTSITRGNTNYYGRGGGYVLGSNFYNNDGSVLLAATGVMAADNGLAYYFIGADVSNRWFSINSTESNFNVLTKFSNRVLIGTTEDNGAKLQVNGQVFASGFMRSGSSDSYVLLGGGGHKAISDFLLKSDIANQELNNNLTTITKSLTVTADWMDTGIKSTDLATGTYIVQVSVHNTADYIWYCYWSGVMSWYASNTNDADTDTDEIILHRVGHAYKNTIYLRTVMQYDGVLKLQIAANKTLSTAATYTFKFKRVI